MDSETWVRFGNRIAGGLGWCGFWIGAGIAIAGIHIADAIR